MGSACCCFHVPDVEENGGVNPHHENCLCAHCCIQNLMNKFGVLFHRGIPPSGQHAVPAVPAEADGSSDRMLPDNARSVCSQVPPDVLARRLVKSSSRSRIEPEPTGHTVKSSCEGGSQGSCSDSSKRALASRTRTGQNYAFPSAEDEDVCPTCLEEYTLENPKITAHCSHHFHLSCIYEWKERSENCPVCGKLMQFDETS